MLAILAVIAAVLGFAAEVGGHEILWSPLAWLLVAVALLAAHLAYPIGVPRRTP